MFGLLNFVFTKKQIILIAILLDYNEKNNCINLKIKIRKKTSSFTLFEFTIEKFVSKFSGNNIFSFFLAKINKFIGKKIFTFSSFFY